MTTRQELPPRSEPLPGFSTQSNAIPFDESDPRAMLTLELLKDMHFGLEHPFLVFPNRDGKSWLVFPSTVSKLFPIPARSEA